MKTPWIIDRASIGIQCLLWKLGINWHNTIRDECTPDFSCCINKYPVGSEERFILGSITNAATHKKPIIALPSFEHTRAQEAGREGAVREYVHKDWRGKTYRLRDMSDEHLGRTIALIERKAKEGIVVRIGGGTCAEDMYYDEYKVMGEESKKLMHYEEYMKESKRRKGK